MKTFEVNYVLIFLITTIEIGSNLKAVVAYSNYHQLHDGSEGSSDFSNQWIIDLDGSTEAADLLAMKLGYKNLGEVRTYYMFKLCYKYRV